MTTAAGRFLAILGIGLALAVPLSHLLGRLYPETENVRPGNVLTMVIVLIFWALSAMLAALFPPRDRA